MADYQLAADESVIRTSDDTLIPPDPANVDRLAYQDWLAGGGVPDPAPLPGKPQSVTASEFLNRIPPAVLPVLWGNPSTGILLLTLAAASVIDLTDPSVQGGINALVPAVLTADQAAAILDH